MALVKNLIVDLIEILENGSVQVRTKTAIMEDGKQISSTFHRHVVVPGDTYAGEDTRVQAICAATHTAEIIAAYQASSVAQPE
jgi:archaellum component FlaF (FlaF/FlaG flagellin family)